MADLEIDGWGLQGLGGHGRAYGEDLVKQFLRDNGVMRHMIVGKRVVMNGFEWSHEKKLLQLFSAPNFAGRCGNEGAIMEICEDWTDTILTFDSLEQLHVVD